MTDLLDRRQVAELLGVGVITLDRLRKAGKIPYLQIGHLIKFKSEDIESCVENFRASDSKVSA